MKFSSDKELKRKYDGKTAKGMRLADMSKYGLNKRWYGGNLRHVGELQGTPIKILLAQNNVTLGVMIDETKDLAGLTDYEAKCFGVEVPFAESSEMSSDDYTRKQLIELIADLGGETSGREKKDELMQIYSDLKG